MKNTLFTDPKTFREFTVLEIILALMVLSMIIWFAKKQEDVITLDKNTNVIIITNSCSEASESGEEESDEEDVPAVIAPLNLNKPTPNSNHISTGI